MNIIDLKATITAITGVAIPALDMERQKSKDLTGKIDPATGKVALIPEPWYSYWDNTNRLRVVMHEEIYQKLHEAKKRGRDELLAITGLAIKPVTIVTPVDKPSYRRIVVITPNIEDSF